MPFAVLLFALDVILVIHAAKTGRFSPWAYVIILLPGIGSLAYILVELLPEWLGSVKGQKAQRKVLDTIDPGRTYRALLANVSVADTIANRAALAQECLTLGRFEEAAGLYKRILAEPLGDEPASYSGLARAELGLGQPQKALATLETLRERHPDTRSSEIDLLHGQVLEACGKTGEALAAYVASGHVYPGLEPRVRYVQLLLKEGRTAEAQKVAQDIVKMARLAPAHFQKAQASWIAEAQKIAGG